MNIVFRFSRFVVAYFLLTGFVATNSALAQTVSDSHLKEARAAIAAIHATDRFDAFLGNTARELKNELMRKDPNLERIISETVEEEAIGLATRRSDLEKEVARIYAKYFTEEELKQIAAFYSSDAGQKLLAQGPNAVVDADGAYNIWRQGIAQDLAANVGRNLAQKINETRAETGEDEATAQEADAPQE